ncbi:MAG TPA: iron-containing alcohol dehydrogenase family protein [Xanthobacteraceae bacterium]|nr:iron-containing alcohol dehydrogenase family protein [Xanthobacteraceae bacterium]
MRLTKTVGQYLLGRGALQQIGQLLDEADSTPNRRIVFLVDYFFADGRLANRLPVGPADVVRYIDTTDEPTTEQVDAIAGELRRGVRPSAVVGIGGGCTMDIAKAVSNLLSNPGQAADYQGWDLVKAPGVFKIGVPTISGTGAEASRTCVMMNQAKNLKLGMNSDYTVFDRLVLDPELTASVPRAQYFYTGMDSYIHCIESLAGGYRHAFADALSRQALAICREVFLSDDMQADDAREQLMVASFLGGSAIGNSYVGLVHPFSAGLSMVFHTHHCIGNCIALDALGEFYPREVEEFRRMMQQQKIELPRGLCRDLTDAQEQALYDATVIHAKPLANALGDDFKSVLTRDKVAEIFARM